MQRLPIWLRVLGIPVCVLVVWGMISERGIWMGVLTAVVYAPLAIGMLAWDRMAAWAHEHPFLDSLVQFPLAFVALALLTDWSLAMCALVGFSLGAVLVAFAAYLRHLRMAKAR